MAKGFYSTTEVADILRVSRITVFQRIKSGKIKAEKIGRNYIVSHESLLGALGQKVGAHKKEEIDRVVKRAMKDYKEVFKRLGKE